MIEERSQAFGVRIVLLIILVVTAVTLGVLINHSLEDSSPNNVGLVEASATQGACVIGPQRQTAVERLGTGTEKSSNVCDAGLNGCGFCIQECRTHNKIIDNYNCPLDGPDEFCNPDFPNDPDCGENVCDDLADNDGDGLFDCQDPDCSTDPFCREVSGPNCFDGLDNDLDGGIDCLDADCFNNEPVCFGV